MNDEKSLVQANFIMFIDSIKWTWQCRPTYIAWHACGAGSLTQFLSVASLHGQNEEENRHVLHREKYTSHT